MRMLTSNSRRFNRSHDYHFGRARTAPSVVRERVQMVPPSRREAGSRQSTKQD
jgi:hypothetical protein